MMRKYFFLCTLSAAAGASLVQWADRYDPMPRLAAQESGLVPVTKQPGSRSANRRVRTTALRNGITLTEEERTNIRVYEEVNQSVVNINTKSLRQDSFFFMEVPSEGAGSGSILDRKGHILTNYHVVEGAQLIEVTLASGNTYTAKLVGHDATDDVAVLKISAPVAELHPVTLGESSTLRVGQKAYAIGNPFGLDRTLTVGIISSLNRTLPSQSQRRVMKSIIQVDAAMNPGNSGGPLLDTSGRVVGMNTAIASKTGQNTGVGFAIPVSRIKRIVPELIRQGHVTRPEVGITRVMQTERGLLIATVEPGGPAERAGLKGFRIVRRQHREGPFVYETKAVDRSVADLITAVDGAAIRTVDDFLTIIEQKKPGDNVQLTVVRNGRETNVSIKLTAEVGRLN